MYKVDLSEKEVKALGEGRWFRKHWKRLALVNGGLLVVLLAVAIGLERIGVADVPRLSVMISLAVIWGIVYILSLRKMERQGKVFLQLTKQTGG